MQKSIPSIVVLISGRGSNLGALIEYGMRTRAYNISAVISNRSDAGGLGLATAHGIPVKVLDHTLYDSRASFDTALAREIEAFEPALVVLAGFMRILSAGFVQHFENRLVNIHPSLLPAFVGLNTHQQAIDAGVRVHGATVHLVTAELDHGPILDQAVLQVLPGDTAQSLGLRVLALEHAMYPRAVASLAAGLLTVRNNTINGVFDAPLLHQIQ